MFNIPIPVPGSNGISTYTFDVEFKILGFVSIKKKVQFWVNLQTKRMGAKVL